MSFSSGGGGGGGGGVGGSSSSASTIHYGRQSRLPSTPSAATSAGTNRLSFAASPSSNSKPSTIASTFQPATLKMQYIATDNASQYNQRNQPQQQQQQPNANTSGLPAPRHRSVEATGQHQATGAIPSTVGSALRRRQASASPQIAPATAGGPLRPSLRLPSPCMSSPSSVNPIGSPYSSGQLEPSASRRSQSQRPLDATGHPSYGRQPALSSSSSSGNFRQSNSFTVHLRQPALVGKKTLHNQSCDSLRSMGAPEDDDDDDEGDDDDDDDDDDDAELKESVEALPPLKSTSYISRLMTPNGRERAPSKAEPQPFTRALGASCNQSVKGADGGQLEGQNQTTVGVKPSQLVKPLVMRNGLQSKPMRRDSNSDANTQSATDSSSSASLSRTRSAPTKGRASQSGLGGGGGRASKLPALAAAAAPVADSTKTTTTVTTRRLSLQHSGYGSPRLRLREPSQTSGSKLQEAEANQANDDNCEDGDDEEEEEDEDQDEEEDEDEDDDSTTATTLTQMSDSNLILNGSAGHEFNSMIQMLSSKAILGGALRAEQLKSSSSSSGVRNRSVEAAAARTNTTTTTTTIADSKQRQQPRDLAEANLSQLPRVKGSNGGLSKVVKSQSLSFTKHRSESHHQMQVQNTYGDQQQQQQQISMQKTISIAMKSSLVSESLVAPNRPPDAKHRARSRPDRAFKLARPKSRIIFDPTSSKFHVSCIEQNNREQTNSKGGGGGGSGCFNRDANNDDDDDDYADDGLQSSNDDSSDENGLLEMEPIDSLAGRSSNDHHQQDELSRSLLNTHNQIITLRSLASTSKPPPPPPPHRQAPLDFSDGNNDSIRRLNECRGSLESLVRAKQRPPMQAEPPLQGCYSRSEYEHLQPTTLGNQTNSMDRKRTKSPVGSALRTLFGLNSSQQSTASLDGARKPAASDDSNATRGSSSSKTATIVRHSSLRSDPRPFDRLQGIEFQLQQQQQPREGSRTPEPANQARANNLGSELLLKAGKKLSASSSSLTSKFRFMSSSSSSSNSKQAETTPPPPPTKSKSKSKTLDEDRASSNEIRRSLSIAYKGSGNFSRDNQFLMMAGNNSGQAQNNASLPPRMPTYETPMKTLDSNGVDSQNQNGRVSNNCDYKTIDQKSASLCDDTAEYGAVSCLDNDGDATILSDTSTLHGDSSNMIYINKCAELERTIESLKNKLIGKEKELTDLQLKQWSSDYLIDQLKSTISRLEKENAQLKNNVMVNVNRVNL